MYIIDKVYIIVHVRIILLKEFIYVIVFYCCFFGRIKQFFYDWKSFQICKQMWHW